MVSPYLERRLRSYREALREIQKRHAARRARKAAKKGAARTAGHLRLIPTKSRHRDADGPGQDA